MFGAGHADSSLRCGVPLHPEYRGSGKCRVAAESDGDGDKESDRAKIEPVDGGQRATCVCKQPDGIRRHRQHNASEPLRGKVKRHGKLGFQRLDMMAHRASRNAKLFGGALRFFRAFNGGRRGRIVGADPAVHEEN